MRTILRTIAALTLAAVAASCGPPPETKGDRFETYRPRLVALKERINTLLNSDAVARPITEIEGVKPPMHIERDGSIVMSNVAFFHPDEIMKDAPPEFDLDYYSPQRRGIGWLRYDNFGRSEKVDDYFVQQLEDALVPSPYLAFYFVSDLVMPKIESETAFTPGAVRIDMIMIEPGSLSIVASCSIDAVSSSELRTEYRESLGPGYAMEAEGRDDLKRNARIKVAACLAEQTGGDFRVEL